MIDSYYTVLGQFSNETVIEKSKFICYIKGINNEDEAREFINSVKKVNSLANHNCYAYIADDNSLCMKFSDDGEPQGTAGLPMLEVLKNKKLYKTVAIVTRYFGGVKLGTGGLTRAYSGAVSQCLALSNVVNMQIAVNCIIESDYESYSKLLKLLSTDSISVNNTEFNDRILIDLVVKQDYIGYLKQSLLDLFRGKNVLTEKSVGYFSFGAVCQK